MGVSPWVFGVFQEDPQILRYEIEHFDILMVGIVPLSLVYNFSGFFSGRGKTWPVFWVNLAGVLLNLFLDYALIFGRFGFPEWGMKGWARYSLCTIAGCSFRRAPKKRES